MYKEILDYRDYHQETRRESRFVPGLLITEEGLGVVYCPRCKSGRKGLQHGEEIQCVCGLKMQLFGNALHIWE
jgi:hypothetical protein